MEVAGFCTENGSHKRASLFSLICNFSLVRFLLGSLKAIEDCWVIIDYLFYAWTSILLLSVF